MWQDDLPSVGVIITYISSHRPSPAALELRHHQPHFHFFQLCARTHPQQSTIFSLLPVKGGGLVQLSLISHHKEGPQGRRGSTKVHSLWALSWVRNHFGSSDYFKCTYGGLKSLRGTPPWRGLELHDLFLMTLRRPVEILKCIWNVFMCGSKRWLSLDVPAAGGSLLNQKVQEVPDWIYTLNDLWPSLSEEVLVVFKGWRCNFWGTRRFWRSFFINMYFLLWPPWRGSGSSWFSSSSLLTQF